MTVKKKNGKKKNGNGKKNGKTKPVSVKLKRRPYQTAEQERRWKGRRGHLQTSGDQFFTLPDRGWRKALGQERSAKRLSTVSVSKGTTNKAWSDSKAKRDARGWANALQRDRNR